MTSDDYRFQLTALGLSQVGAAKALGIGERTSRRYASQGVPEKHAAWVREKFSAIRQAAKKMEEEK